MSIKKPLVGGVLCIKYPINWGECSSDGLKAIKTVNKCFICHSTVGRARGALRHACDLKATWKRHQRTLPSFERAENPTEYSHLNTFVSFREPNVLRSPKNPTSQRNVANYVDRNFLKKILASEDFLPARPMLGERSSRLSGEGKEKKSDNTRRRWTVGVESSRCAPMCMQGHQSINTREPVSLRLAMGLSNSSPRNEAHPSYIIIWYPVDSFCVPS